LALFQYYGLGQGKQMRVIRHFLKGKKAVIEGMYGKSEAILYLLRLAIKLFFGQKRTIYVSKTSFFEKLKLNNQ
jgi:hypothetical protein